MTTEPVDVPPARFDYREVTRIETLARAAKAEQEAGCGWVGSASTELIRTLRPDAVLRLLAMLRVDLDDAERYRQIVARSREMAFQLTEPADVDGMS